MNKLYPICFSLLFASCGTRIDYVGTGYAPTQNVEVFVDPTAIAKPYSVVGKGFVRDRILSGKNSERIQAKSIIKAKQKGADAILIQDIYTSSFPTGVNTVFRTDSVGKGVVTVGSSTIDHSATHDFTILFLKYK